MANKTQHPCKHKGCPNTIRKGNYCELHLSDEIINKRRFDKYRTPAHERGYDNEWHKISKAYITLNPICVKCNELGELVDHIIPVPLGTNDIENLQTLCRKCHAIKTQEDKEFYERKPKFHE